MTPPLPHAHGGQPQAQEAAAQATLPRMTKSVYLELLEALSVLAEECGRTAETENAKIWVRAFWEGQQLGD